ncbi:MAG TPA: 2-C-methyl-D-erythritol 4-phosphate cytidylyltransferase [Paenibacillus sp.]|uniref:2-C-methyl-D-erythritol 4-phosphate cytidylyltransferase n=1 Tax=Paenibacillus sp. TaxID=58172 RepID=UPI002C9E235F|nr:2-C-methyl-D-erythritol 4-phosphate cytidylyltransferase [Paenibacillus sp.]HUC91417.1 2-C-methyl-D-erythritol 4-phosphate cytidylyltransferase [Paenibacillus sp.]
MNEAKGEPAGGAGTQWSAVIVAAGRGTRMGAAESKQYLPLLNKPILAHTLAVFDGMSEIRDIVLVTEAGDVERCRRLAAEHGLRKVAAVVPGGGERQHSVRLGLAAARTPWVMVHDGVRPLVTPESVRRCMEAAYRHGAAVLAVPVKDTIKKVDAAGIIESTPDRRSLWAIQTPQAFRRDLLEQCHSRAEREGFVGTDDAMVVERYGHPVAVAEGDYTNIKITTPDDLPYAAFLLAGRGGGTSGGAL